MFHHLIHKLSSKLKQWKTNDEDGKPKGPGDDVATRQTYLRYLKSNPIFISLCDAHGGTVAALKVLGYASVFNSFLKQYSKVSNSPNENKNKKTIADGIRALREELDALQKMVDQEER